MTVLERKHAVVTQARAPPQTTTSPCSSGTRRRRSLRESPPNRKTAGRPRRNRHDGRAEIALVLVLMKREACAGLVAIEQAGHRGRTPGKPPACAAVRATSRNTGGIGGHGRPFSGSRAVVADSPWRSSHPTQAAAIGHGHRHAESAGVTRCRKGAAAVDVLDRLPPMRPRGPARIRGQATKRPVSERFVPGVGTSDVSNRSRESRFCMPPLDFNRSMSCANRPCHGRPSFDTQRRIMIRIDRKLNWRPQQPENRSSRRAARHHCRAHSPAAPLRK